MLEGENDDEDDGSQKTGQQAYRDLCGQQRSADGITNQQKEGAENHGTGKAVGTVRSEEFSPQMRGDQSYPADKPGNRDGERGSDCSHNKQKNSITFGVQPDAEGCFLLQRKQIEFPSIAEQDDQTRSDDTENRQDLVP
ncbi:hypothetical protein SDC9_70474 [bioreactor metagenome]|uniref:Uncharacterized protein n=1 Tax=bioreactor metagenome TaxID=1076179 RepID=A0A644Y741_9ZZZZ